MRGPTSPDGGDRRSWEAIHLNGSRGFWPTCTCASPQRRKDGSSHSYFQLAHNSWVPVAKHSRVKTLHNLGRADSDESAEVVPLEGVGGLSLRHLYRAVDFLETH